MVSDLQVKPAEKLASGNKAWAMTQMQLSNWQGLASYLKRSSYLTRAVMVG